MSGFHRCFKRNENTESELFDMWILIPMFAIFIGGAIPLTAIYTAHQRSQTKLQIQLAEKELLLEEKRLQIMAHETEKMRLELEQSKIVLESRKRLEIAE